jgi:dGTPase
LSREDRFSGSQPDKPGEFRSPSQLDCDRLLYSGALRRLAVIRQVVSPAGGHSFHNRLTHALKVAQVGRRIGEEILSKTNSDLVQEIGGLDPHVVEAAGLAHDLGHPPFGHIAEETLNALLRKNGEGDGYEGNAQSFRIVTRLEFREAEGGLDLTRATLNAILKYPRLRPKMSFWFSHFAPRHHPKFGAYRSEATQFRFARADTDGSQSCVEAQIMDWADDITYAVHDLEDFYRIGLIPLDRLSQLGPETENFIEARFGSGRDDLTDDERKHYQAAALDWFSVNPVEEAYSGSRTQRAALRGLASAIIHNAITGTSLTVSGIERASTSDDEVRILKELTWHYVIDNPRFATEQFGKKRIIETLFDVFAEAALTKKRWNMFPIALQEQLEEGSVSLGRCVADYIWSLGEQRAVHLASELGGLRLEPVMTGVAL